MALTVLVDYDSGNLHSAEKAFQRMAAETGSGEILVSSRPEDVARATRIVLPGDGAFANPWNLGRLDLPQRFGAGPFGVADPGRTQRLTRPVLPPGAASVWDLARGI